MKQTPASAEQPEARGFFAGWNRFWFTPADPFGLHALRVLTGLVLLFWLLAFAGNQDAFFSSAGWFDREAQEAARALQRAERDPMEPPEEAGAPMGWSILHLAGDNLAAVDAIYWASIGVLVLFTLGIGVRITAILTWVIVASFVVHPVIAYDADYLLVIPAFYLMIGYVFYGQLRPSTPLDRFVGPRDAWLFRPATETAAAPSYAANFAVRLFQVHFAVVVVTSLLHKLQIPDWWAGTAFFFPLHSPFRTNVRDLTAMKRWADGYLVLLSFAQYLVLAWQLAFPAFAWRRGLRWLLIGGALVGWAGSAFLFGLPLFGPIFLIACLNYLSPPEWRSLVAYVRGLLPWGATGDVPKSQREPVKVPRPSRV